MTGPRRRSRVAGRAIFLFGADADRAPVAPGIEGILPSFEGGTPSIPANRNGRGEHGPGVAGRLLALAVALWAACPSGTLASGEDCVAEEPPGYRMSDFRAPVPCALAGATVVSTEALRLRIEQDSPLLVDVLPSPRRPEGLAEGTPWLPPTRRNIPGTVWLPNTGFGELPVEEEVYLRANLERLTGGDRSRSVVFYCLADCWMSWNAARRAMEWGYTSVIWYPDGTDGWQAADLPLADSSPVPRSEGE